MQKKKTWWKIPAGIVTIAVLGFSLFSILYSPDQKAPEPVQNATNSPTVTEPAVLSDSIDTSSDTALTYEQALSEANARCESSGLSAGTSAYDTCVEQETSQIAH